MQLGWPWKQKQRSVALDIVPLKKIIAVSDEYWEVLYSPIINSVARSLGVFEKQKAKLYCDYVDQFVRLVRRSKGTVQDDPLLVPLHTFSLSIAFSSLYVARLCNSFEFVSISKSKNKKGERTTVFPWFSVPVESDIKLAKVSRLYPAYVYAIPVFHSMINDMGWKWLHGKPEVLKGLLDTINSNGEKGLFSGILADMRAAPLGKATGGESLVKSEGVESEVLVSNTSESASSIDDLINGIGGDGKEISLDELLESNKVESNSDIPQNTDVEDNNALDLSIFEDKENKGGSDGSSALLEASDSIDSREQTTDGETDSSSTDALDEFTAFLASSAEVESLPDNENVSGESSLLFSTESSISSDLLKWGLERIKDDSSESGVYLLLLNNKKVIVIDRDKGLLNFVRSDYTLDSEAAYASVAEEVLNDLLMSNMWIENAEGSDIWEVSINGDDIKAVVLNVEVPPSCKPLDDIKYVWPEKLES